jgi:hypothetical protein
MMKLTVVLAVIAVVLFLAFRLLFGGQTDSWHQRLTVAVETPAGEVSGSAVTEVTFVDYSGPMALPEASGPRGTVRGEAVAVEVLPGKWLFALLDGAENPEGAAKSWSFATYAPKRDANNMSRNFWDRVADIHDQPYDTPVPIPPESWPLMVTFDDITKPETVRRVDPDDLDATFGCDRENRSKEFPWRDARLTYRDWVKQEVERLSRDQAADKAGLVGPKGDAIAELYAITDDMNISAAEEARAKELHSIFTEQERERWYTARQALITELPATLPTPEAVSAKTGVPCYRLKSLTLEITRAGVTEGRLDQILTWLSPYAERPLLPEIDPSDNSLRATLRQGDFIVRQN